MKFQHVTCPFCDQGRLADAPCPECNGDGMLIAMSVDKLRRVAGFLAAFDAWRKDDSAPLLAALLEARRLLDIEGA